MVLLILICYPFFVDGVRRVTISHDHSLSQEAEEAELNETFVVNDTHSEAALVSSFENFEHYQIGNEAWSDFKANSLSLIGGLSNHNWNMDAREKGSLSFGDFLFLAGDYVSGKKRVTGAMTKKAALALVKKIRKKPAEWAKKPIKQDFLEEVHKAKEPMSKEMMFLLAGSKWITLAAENINHFGDVAREQYTIMHEYALYLSRLAGKIQRRNSSSAFKTLEDAFALEAAANHYMTDLFAPGHQRTPRKEIYESFACFAMLPTVRNQKSGLMAAIMHDEDNAHGLKYRWCDEQIGETWTGFGDGQGLWPRNGNNRKQMKKTIVRGLDQLLSMYLLGMHGDALLKTSFYQQLQNEEGRKFPCELFSYKGGNSGLECRPKFPCLVDREKPPPKLRLKVVAGKKILQERTSAWGKELPEYKDTQCSMALFRYKRAKKRLVRSLNKIKKQNSKARVVVQVQESPQGDKAREVMLNRTL